MGLSDDVRVGVRVLGDDGLEDVREFGIFDKGGRGWGEARGGAEGDFGGGRIGGKECEGVGVGRGFRWEGVLSDMSVC